MFRMDEDRARFIDATCKLLAVLGLAIGSSWTVFTYFQARESEARTAAVEARKPFQSMRLQLYSDAITAVTTIATGKKGKELDEAKEKFWALYWGPMGLVENSAVEVSMIRLGLCIRGNECQQPIENLALQLTHDCRDSIAEGFDVKLPDTGIALFQLKRLRK